MSWPAIRPGLRTSRPTRSCGRWWLATGSTSQLPAYLLAITRNLYRDQLRRPRPVLLELDDHAQDRQPSADRRIESRSELRHLHGQLRHVAAGNRRALLLYAVRHLSYSDIAARLGVSVGAVKSRIARAREALKAPAHDSQKRKPS